MKTCAPFTLTVLSLGFAALASEITLPWSTIDCGGGMLVTADGVFELQGTIGQPDAGTTEGGIYTLASGFRNRLPSLDIDRDGDVDLDDHSDFVDCLEETTACTPEEFERADLDNDGSVNLKDFALLQRGFTGWIPSYGVIIQPIPKRTQFFRLRVKMQA